MVKYGIPNVSSKNRIIPIGLCIILTTILVISVFPQSTVAKSELSKSNLRAVVSDIQSLNVAIVDQVTPSPSTDGKDMLFVDGSFYSQKGNNKVAEYVQSQALSGMPVVVIGSGYEDLCDRLDLYGYDLKPQCKNDDGGEYHDVPIAFRGVKVFPWKIPNGLPFCAYLSVMGDSNQLTSGVNESIVEWSEHISSLQAPDYTEVSKSEASEMGLMLDGGGASSWERVIDFTVSTGTAWSPHGRVNMYLLIKKLFNDMNPSYNYYSFIINKQFVPGDAAWGNNWRTSYSKLYHDVDDYFSGGWPWQELISHGPTTTTGQEHVSFSIGTGEVGLSLGYDIPDVVVHDLSDNYLGLAKWEHNINEGADCGLYGYFIEPGFTIRVPEDAMPYVCVLTEYQAEFSKPRWPWWNYWWSPWIGVGWGYWDW